MNRHTRPSRVRRLVVVAALAGSLLTASALPAVAAPPERAGGPVTHGWSWLR